MGLLREEEKGGREGWMWEVDLGDVEVWVVVEVIAVKVCVCLCVLL